MSDDSAQVLPGTLDMLVLKVISIGPEHGWGVGQRLQQMSSGVFDVNQGSIYPALQRLLKKGWIRSTWKATESGRRARYYSITASGTKQLERQRQGWSRQASAVEAVLTWTNG